MTPEDEAALKKQRCIPCLSRYASQHQTCWALQQNVPPQVEGEYWCECPCGTEELEHRSWGKDAGLDIPEQADGS